MKTFKHSGDLGDIIYSLPTIRGLGGGILYLDPEGGAKDGLVSKQCPDGKTKLDKEKIHSLKPILEAQPYIKGVKIWKGELVTHNLDEFRIVFSNPNKRSPTSNLSDCHLERFGLSFSETDLPWLNVAGKTKLNRSIIISRSPRYQAGYAQLNSMKMYLKDNAIFIGLPKEHEYFEYTFDIKIPYQKTETIMELAEVINGSEVFIGNPSFPLSLAIGMGHTRIIQEVYPKVPNTVFSNKLMTYL
jgi:hypothetical protein